MKDIILIGGGGHCISCIEIIEQNGSYNIKGILDLPNMVGKDVLGYPIIGTDNDIEKYINDDVSFCITIGQVTAGDNLRKNIYKRIKSIGAKTPTIISPYSKVSKHSSIGDGTVILSNVLINASSIVGDNCIINNKSLIEHGANVGSHSHIATGVIINGECSIGNNCFIGSGSIIRNNIIIEKNISIGMGSVITKSLMKSGVYFGNPARIVEK